MKERKPNREPSGMSEKASNKAVDKAARQAHSEDGKTRVGRKNKKRDIIASAALQTTPTSAAAVTPERDRTVYGTVLTAVIILVVVVANVIIFGLANANDWYFYSSTPVEHTIGNGTDDYLKEVSERGKVTILFCDTEANLKEEPVFNLVKETAEQFAARYKDFVSVKFVDVYKNPGAVHDYKYKVDENGDEVKINDVNSYSVIFIADNKDFAVLPMQSFFILDGNKEIVSYTGEEVTAAMIHRVLTPETRPTAYFIQRHRETYSSQFADRLVCAGYNLEVVDLLKQDIPESADGHKGDLIVISNPQYDFTLGNAELGIVGEIDKLEDFLADGGSIFAMLDPVVTSTVKLEKFLSEWGLTVSRKETTKENGVIERETVMIRDNNNSITTDGYALITEINREGIGKSIADDMDKIGAGRVIIGTASPIDVAAVDGKETGTLLETSSSAATYANGKKVNNDGRYTVAAVSRDTTSGGSIFVVGSRYLTASEALTTNEYGNRDLIFCVIGEMCDISVPIGGTHLLFDETGLEDLTMWEARLWTAAIVAILPVAAAVTGTVILVRRRNR